MTCVLAIGLCVWVGNEACLVLMYYKFMIYSFLDFSLFRVVSLASQFPPPSTAITWFRYGWKMQYRCLFSLYLRVLFPWQCPFSNLFQSPILHPGGLFCSFFDVVFIPHFRSWACPHWEINQSFAKGGKPRFFVSMRIRSPHSRPWSAHPGPRR